MIVDDDVAGFSISQGALVLSESGSSATIDVALLAGPTSDVVVVFANPDKSELELSIDAVTFTPQNWQSKQSIQLSGVPDLLRDGAQIVNVSVAVHDERSDAQFRELASQSIQVTIQDRPVTAMLVNQEADRVVVRDAFTNQILQVNSALDAVVIQGSDLGERIQVDDLPSHSVLIVAGPGADTLELASLGAGSYDGQTGSDTLVFRGSDTTLDINAMEDGRIRGFEMIRWSAVVSNE